MDPVATKDLPRITVVWERKTIPCGGMPFVADGGHGSDETTTFVFEIDPGKRLGWHTDQTEETQYIVPGPGERHRGLRSMPPVYQPFSFPF